MTRLILTHEQADFDAMASLLGAYLLDIDSIPVIPRKVNRNVRSFLTLYGADLPFIEMGDFKHSDIESITLVDTQSLITLKGVKPATMVKVIDHHPMRQDFSRDWQFIQTDTGSTTTYFVEQKAELEGPLSIVQATLLLLGIYEDTGTLTYSNTTGRDGRAAAYLVDMGANLKTVANFLNPPLTSEQLRIYDQLVGEAKTHHINGHRVVISCSDIGDSNEEVSTLAHKMRDLFDPDALFVIFKTREGIRLVARSTSDQIDVGAIAHYFGGGGHDKAAAALIKTESNSKTLLTCENINNQLLEILPKLIKPSLTVAQIMSESPHVIGPDTSIAEASRLMQRYGYEGYPVVENGKIVGLLTRRVVDKAISHKLNLPVASLMDARQIWVRPEDSIQLLQTRMTESGWGQIPVVEEADGRLVGIVTRTDLLKILTSKENTRKKEKYESQLVAALPIEKLTIIRTVAEAAAELKLSIFIVGGFVRDLILGVPSVDFDIVVEGDAIQLTRQLVKKYGGRIIEHQRFGTAKWFLENSTLINGTGPGFLDLISSRMEFYSHPTALPVVERSSIKFDLHRRDFTMNTLALRLDGKHFGELYDYWGGVNDLRQGTIRVLHSLSFIDDPTRILRAIRFEQRFNFSIEERTMQQLVEAKGLLNNLSGDRIRHELDLIFDEKESVSILSRLDELHLLSEIHPGLTWNRSMARAIKRTIHFSKKWIEEFPDLTKIDRRSLGYIFWLSSLPDEVILPISKRLKLSERTQKIIKGIKEVVSLFPEISEKKPSKICDQLDRLPTLSIILGRMELKTDEARFLEDYLFNWKKVKPLVNGNDLKRMGVPSGKRYQIILRKLKEAWLDGQITDQAQEMELLNKLIIQLK